MLNVCLKIQVIYYSQYNFFLIYMKTNVIIPGLIVSFHINKLSNPELSHWFINILKRKDLIDKIIN